MLNTGSGLTWAGTQWSPTNLSLATTKFVAGHFVAGTTGDGFAYIIEDPDGGFSTGVMTPDPGGLMNWQGSNWWTSAGSSGVTFANTTFFGSDPNGDGLTDIYYATSSNWYGNGFSLALMQNTSGTLTWAGTQWSPTNLELAQTRFIPGYWVSGTDESLAYVEEDSDGGFSTGVMTPDPGGLMNWQGSNWWTQPASNSTFYDTALIPADFNGDGLTDLFYVSTTNPTSNGMAVGMAQNTGSALTYAGAAAWQPTNLAYNNTQFVPQR